MTRRYVLRCCACGATYDDDGVRLDCDVAHEPALLRTVYDRPFVVDETPSMARYRAWLPIGKPLARAARTAVYRSDGLAARLGLSRLWIAFNGWWPERDATLATATFKELEAITVLGRFAGAGRAMVLASAGNTAAAFASVATATRSPVVIVIPYDAWEPLARLVEVGPTVKVVTIAGALYEDAIRFAQRLAALPEFVAEGGVRNVGRRDGMGTTLLAAVEAIGALPDVYVQGVGSAAGGLAAHEAALRLVADGRFGARVPRLFLAQNAPFAPIDDAWRARAETIVFDEPRRVRARQRAIEAKVLSNPAPPYAVRGGVREALVESDGRTYAVTNEELRAAMRLFHDWEGIDVEPAAGVAIAALLGAVQMGDVGADETILLHVTGGGRGRIAHVAGTQRPALALDVELLDDEAVEAVRALSAG